MSLLPHTVIPRSMFDMDNWLNKKIGIPSSLTPLNSALIPLNSLEMFDPFDELDQTLSRNLQWLNKPAFMEQLTPRVPHKYRISVECHGYSPNAIKTELKGSKLTVWGDEKNSIDKDQFDEMHFKKCFVIPKHADLKNMISFMANGHLIIEFPLKETELEKNQDLLPKITNAIDGKKQVEMKFTVPENINPEKVHVNIKDRDIIVKAEDTVDSQDFKSKFHYYKRITLPDNTNFDQLKCTYEDNELSICAPLKQEKPLKKVAIEHKKK